MGELKRYRSVVADSIRWEGFAFRPGDIVVSTPPKCGTTWMQRLCALLVFDSVELPAPISILSPWLDMLLAPLDDVVARLDAQQHRRFIKTHTPLDGIPFDEDVTYLGVGRDPRDVAVSSAHHMSNMDIDLFMAKRAEVAGLDDLEELGRSGPGPTDDVALTPLHAWIEGDGVATPMSLAYLLGHLDTFWQQRGNPSVVLFHYDDLLADLPGQLRRLADALVIDVTDERLAELSAAGSFDAMKRDATHAAPNADIRLWRSTSDFFHRGTSGQWREVFDTDLLRRYDERVAELASPDLARWVHEGWLGAAIDIGASKWRPPAHI